MFHKYVLPLLVGVGVVVVVFVGYVTHEKWALFVIPSKGAPKPEGHGGGHDDHAGHDHGTQTDRVKLSPQAQANLGLDVDMLTPEPYKRKMLIPGIVVDRPGESDRIVTSKISGIIKEIYAKPGQTVKAGEPLFRLQLVSELLQSIQLELARSSREIEFAITKRDRIADLVKQGTQAGATLLEEENQVKRLTTQIQSFKRQLQVLGLSSEQIGLIEKGEVITELDVVVKDAPSKRAASSNESGKLPQLFEVQELKVSLGEQIQAGQTLCLLANHQSLFVEGRAFKSEADALAKATEKKEPIRAEFADENPTSWNAQAPLIIHHLSNQVDPTTRTFGFYLSLENQPKTFEQDGRTHFIWRYRPGQRVRLWVPIEEIGTPDKGGKKIVPPFVLSAGAVVREGPEAFVFIQSGDIFIRKPVRVLYEDRNEVVIANDGSISDVEFVVKNQAAAINRALKAATSGGGGGHEGHNH